MYMCKCGEASQLRSMHVEHVGVEVPRSITLTWHGVCIAYQRPTKGAKLCHAILLVRFESCSHNMQLKVNDSVVASQF